MALTREEQARVERELAASPPLKRLAERNNWSPEDILEFLREDEEAERMTREQIAQEEGMVAMFDQLMDQITPEQVARLMQGLAYPGNSPELPEGREEVPHTTSIPEPAPASPSLSVMRLKFQPEPEEASALSELERLIDHFLNEESDGSDLLDFPEWLEMENPELASRYEVGALGAVYRREARQRPASRRAAPPRRRRPRD